MSDSQRVSSPSNGAAIVGGIVLVGPGPFVLITGYLHAARHGFIGPESLIMLIWVGSVVIGLIGLWLLPLGRRWRLILTPPYAFVMTALTCFYGFIYTCDFLHQCFR
jgi:hypothetical protein